MSGKTGKEHFQIRPAQLSDSAGLALVQVESYQQAYRGFFPPEYLAHFTREEQEQDWRAWLPAHPDEILLVAETSSGEIVGYARGIVGPVYGEEAPLENSTDPTPAGTPGDLLIPPNAPASPPEPPPPGRYEGELASMHVRREYQKQGIGRQLFEAAASELQRQGCRSLLLWVLAANHPARGFYERLGGKLLGEKRWLMDEFDNFEVVEVAYGWPDLATFLE